VNEVRLLPTGVEVSFSEVESTLARPRIEERKSAAGLALTATLVVVGPAERLAEAAEALDQLTDVGVLGVLISYGTNPAPKVRVTDQAVALEALRPDFLNNAVAALRLSSLPTVVWWRGGDLATLGRLAELSDRLILDGEDPRPEWACAGALLERTAFSDLRWTRLTRWRALMAHFFDIPEVRAAAPSFNRLRIEGSDIHAARLYAAWLSSTLHWARDVAIDLQERPGAAPLERVELGNDSQVLTLDLAPSRTCVKTTACVHGHPGACRTVSIGDQGLAALISRELRIRSRDLAFERALAAVEGVV
jgi:glucose-6-phosphate dehydrogenase assembly protein OpcA